VLGVRTEAPYLANNEVRLNAIGPMDNTATALATSSAMDWSSMAVLHHLHGKWTENEICDQLYASLSCHESRI
jgi:hypothetical protein